jgi:NAD(P)H-hydrate epimerase
MSVVVLEDVALIVVAFFGAGLTRALDGPVAKVLTIAAKTAPIVAIDIPSGVMGDTGEALGAATAA